MDEPTETSFDRRLKGPDLMRVGIVVAASAVLLGTAAFTLGASPSTNSDPGATATGAPSIDEPGLLPGLPGDGWERAGQGKALPGPVGFREITITAIDGSNVSLATEDGWRRTIALTSATKITKAGQAATLADLKVGDRVRFSQTRNADGTFTIKAIAVIVPKVAGTVTGVTASAFTLRARDGLTWTIQTNSGTAYKVGDANGARSDLATGVAVVVQGTQGSGNTLTALTVNIRLPVVTGEVTAKGATSLTLQRRNGTTVTVRVSADTKFRVRGVADADLGDVTVGMVVVAQGRQSADGSIDAVAVQAGKLGGLRDRPKNPPSSPGTSARPATVG